MKNFFGLICAVIFTIANCTQSNSADPATQGGATPTPAPSPTATPAPICTIDGATAASQATSFTTNAAYVGVCGTPFNSLIGDGGVAVYPGIFNDSFACGMCFSVTGPTGTAILQVAELCPGCSVTSAFDMTESVLNKISGSNGGSPAVTFSRVPCNIPGKVKIWLDAASNDFYLKIRVTNAENPVASLALKSGTTWLPFTHATDNTFTLTPGGAVPKPYELRIVDSFGDTIEETVNLAPGGSVTGGQQFPKCN